MVNEERLKTEYEILCRENEVQSRDAYNHTVRKGSTKTYSEFMEGIKQEWFRIMREKGHGSKTRTV
jgi:hypothetical protein